MHAWIISQLQTSFPGESISEENIDHYLSQLCHHSLQMVTFLARFARQFGRAPKIMAFIEAPTLQTLERSGESLV